MSDTVVEPPGTDALFGEGVEGIDPQAGEWDREFWVGLAVDVHGLDPDLAADRPTAWIVGWVDEQPDRFY